MARLKLAMDSISIFNANQYNIIKIMESRRQFKRLPLSRLLLLVVPADATTHTGILHGILL
jgi:hypothetical protein